MRHADVLPEPGIRRVEAFAHIFRVATGQVSTVPLVFDDSRWHSRHSLDVRNTPTRRRLKCRGELRQVRIEALGAQEVNVDSGEHRIVDIVYLRDEMVLAPPDGVIAERLDVPWRRDVPVDATKAAIVQG